ncbi:MULTISPECIES: hypothetical protein [Streptomyces]
MARPGADLQLPRLLQALVNAAIARGPDVTRGAAPSAEALRIAVGLVGAALDEDPGSRRGARTVLRMWRVAHLADLLGTTGVNVMISVLLNDADRLIADIIQDPRQGNDLLWVCVRSGSRTAGKGWLGCWSSGKAAQEDAGVRKFLSALGRDLTDHVSKGPNGPVLTDHYFHEGWQSWGPGTPGPLLDVAGEPSPTDDSLRGVHDLRLDAEG